MRRFLKRLLFFASLGGIPYLLLLAGYIRFDPFSVVRPKANYSGLFIPPNLDVVSTGIFDQNYKKYGYNSFILGSSRTMGYKPEAWQALLDSSRSKPCAFVFGAPGETVKGMDQKLRYILKQGAQLDNVLLILCKDHAFLPEGEQKGIVFLRQPQVSGQSAFAYQKAFFDEYMRPRFLACYYTYLLTHRYYGWMKRYIEQRNFIWDPVHNELTIEEDEQMMKHDPDRFYKERDHVFYPRSGETTDSVDRIDTAQVRIMQDMVALFKAHGTSYKVIISPLYNQERFSPADRAILQQVFGDHLYDFSGKNWITDDKRHYFESSHYRKEMGDTMMKLIYRHNRHTFPVTQ